MDQRRQERGRCICDPESGVVPRPAASRSRGCAFLKGAEATPRRHEGRRAPSSSCARAARGLTPGVPRAFDVCAADPRRRPPPPGCQCVIGDGEQLLEILPATDRAQTLVAAYRNWQEGQRQSVPGARRARGLRAMPITGAPTDQGSQLVDRRPNAIPPTDDVYKAAAGLRTGRKAAPSSGTSTAVCSRRATSFKSGTRT
jgi:hypothetical protein